MRKDFHQSFCSWINFQPDFFPQLFPKLSWIVLEFPLSRLNVRFQKARLSDDSSAEVNSTTLLKGSEVLSAHCTISCFKFHCRRHQSEAGKIKKVPDVLFFSKIKALCIKHL
jgi:hypothetical protein